MSLPRNLLSLALLLVPTALAAACLPRGGPMGPTTPVELAAIPYASAEWARACGRDLWSEHGSGYRWVVVLDAGTSVVNGVALPILGQTDSLRMIITMRPEAFPEDYVHEMGHGFGLGHYDGGIMNPITRVGQRVTDVDRAAMRARGYPCP